MLVVQTSLYIQGQWHTAHQYLISLVSSANPSTVANYLMSLHLPRPNTISW